MRGLVVGWLVSAGACVAPAIATAAGLNVGILEGSVSDPPTVLVTSGVLDANFSPYTSADARRRSGNYWLRVTPGDAAAGIGLPVLIVHRARQSLVQVFAPSEITALRPVVQLPRFRGAQDEVFALSDRLAAGQPLYAHIVLRGIGSEELSISTATLDSALVRSAENARIIALCFGALIAMSLAAVLVWTQLADKVFIWYGLLFSTQALYVVYLSGQGFTWPLLAYAAPLNSFAWNVPAAMGGAFSCLLARELADLQRYVPRIYHSLTWFAAAFAALTVANLLKLVGLGPQVNLVGNLLFVACAIVTLAGAGLAWLRGSSAAGWFLVAWTLLETLTIAVAARLLFSSNEAADHLLNYYGLPLSMVAAAILIALGVADRLRAQRLALTEAERRAQTDALTGVLNRRSLIERLHAACLRAQARALPISLLFIDLDHFKQINDSFGHQAGDACLRAIVEPIHAELRQSDVIGRYGGEEFVVILSSADSAAARPIAQRILDRVAAVRVDGYGAPIRLTCSIGVAASDTLGVWGEHLIAHADAAVYIAKRLGRNQVQVAARLAA